MNGQQSTGVRVPGRGLNLPPLSEQQHAVSYYKALDHENTSRVAVDSTGIVTWLKLIFEDQCKILWLDIY